MLTSTAVFPPNQLPLFKWMSEYYGASLGEIIANALPARMSPRMVLCAQATAELARIFAEEPALLLKLGQRAPLQRKIAEILAEAASPVPLSHLSGLGAGARSALNSLVQKGLAAAELVSHRKLTAPEPKKTASSAQLLFSGVIPEQLTQAQENAFAAVSKSLKQSSFSPFLLFGVTGSGKTEIYLRAVEQVLQGPGCALIVVPEIALTPQFIDQFQSRLNAPIALLHSQVGAQARWEAWEALLNGSIRVALGARSAVFAPFTNLSLIVIDEEHESSYKQSDGLRYNARDVAVMRAKLSNAVIVLGSATPSFESLVNAQNRRYKI
ncbi:MAG TPA: DEAD/DEAH box helicase, partial [Oligoflexia bacterium]|nr:DEAD/DEAH box helicase [Oligoflexia bacterium]